MESCNTSTPCFLAPYFASPTPVYFGRTINFSFFVMSQEGQSLPELAETYDGGFDDHTTSLLLYHGLIAVMAIHHLGVALNDITLANMVLPLTSMKERILLVDFGDATDYNEAVRRRDVNNVFMSIGLVSRGHLLLAQCRSYHLQYARPSTEDSIQMIREETNFNENDPFQWE